MLPQSKIFDEYAKLAMDRGLVKKAEAAVVKEAAEDETAKSIGLLYGVKPNGKEDDIHIMEKAHPETVAVARSYDALNAIVEDNILRQEIMTWIAEKVPNGQLSMKRYVAAHNALLKSLVNIGFTTDNAEQEGLRKLADTCTQELTKKAMWGAAAKWGIPALLGFIALIQHTPDLAVSVSTNSQNVLDAIADMKGDMYLDDMEQSVQELKAASDNWQQAAYLGGQLRNAIQSNPEYQQKVMEFASNIPGIPMERLPAPIQVTAEYLVRLGEVTQSMPEWKNRVKMFTPKGSEWGPSIDKLRMALSPFLPQESTDLGNALIGLDNSVQTEKRKISSEVAGSPLLRQQPQQQQQQSSPEQQQQSEELQPYSPAFAASQILEIGKDG